MIIVSLTLIFFSLFLKASIKLNPKKEEIKKLARKTLKLSYKNKFKVKGISMLTLRTETNTPNIKKIIFKLII